MRCLLPECDIPTRIQARYCASGYLQPPKIILIKHLNEHVNNVRIELSAGIVKQGLSSLIDAHSRCVCRLMPHAFVAFSHRDDSCEQRNFITLEPSRITVTVPTLLMSEHRFGKTQRIIKRVEYSVPNDRMTLDLIPLIIRKMMVDVQK